MPVVLSSRWFAGFITLVGVLACGEPRPAGDARHPSNSSVSSAVDDYGAPLPTGRTFTRIVALEPATTEILFAIGAGDRLVGRTRHDLYPDSARLIPDVGEGIRPNIEAIIAVRPDLVVLYASDDNRATRDRLRTMGIEAVAFRSDRIADFERITLALGRLVGDTVRARAVRDSVARTLANVRDATRDLERPTVLMPVWFNPLFVIGGASFMNELVDIAGGRNVYDTLAAPSPQVTFEDVVRRDPDVILVGPLGRERITTSPAWRVLRAVRDGRVVAYDTLVTGRPGVRLGEAAVSLARLLHPGVSVAPR
ncbi:MAG TPA: helical backbone metal receptor [Gemmatimonadaceae bacterium]|nr:helical backbone metal receptor [Gemmatimonadaceae bacterium]